MSTRDQDYRIYQEKKESMGSSKKQEKSLSDELSSLINRHSRENDSNTPDFILAGFMMMCLRAGEYLVNMREQWKEYPNLTKKRKK